MALTLRFGAQDLAPVHNFEIERKPSPEGALERWRLETDVGGPTPALAEQAAQQLEAALTGAATLKLLGDGMDIRVLAPGDCRRGPALERVEIAARDPASAHERRRMTLTFAATLQDADCAVQAHTMAVTVLGNSGEAPAVITRGRIVLRAGESPAAHEGEITSAAPGYRRVRREVTRDAREPSLEYMVEDRQAFVALPHGVEEGSYSRTTVREGGGAREIVKGFFIGASARVRAEELAVRFGARDSRIEENQFARRVDFEFTSPGTGAGAGVISFSEQVSFTLKRRVVDHPVLGAGQPHYRQVIGAPWLEVVQSGGARGHDAHPAAPAPLHPNDIIEREVTRAAGFETRWRYLFRLLNAGAEA